MKLFLFILLPVVFSVPTDIASAQEQEQEEKENERLQISTPSRDFDFYPKKRRTSLKLRYGAFGKNKTGEFGILLGVRYFVGPHNKLRPRIARVWLPLPKGYSLKSEDDQLHLYKGDKEIDQVGRTRWWWDPSWQRIDGVKIEASFKDLGRRIYRIRARLTIE